jgi:hypothetical protein
MQFPKPRKPRVSKKYRQWLATKPCLFCGIEPSGPPHHDREIGPCGASRKPSDTYCLPICHKCHDHIHNYSKDGAEMLKRVGREERMAAMLDYNDAWMQRVGV